MENVVCSWGRQSHPSNNNLPFTLRRYTSPAGHTDHREMYIVYWILTVFQWLYMGSIQLRLGLVSKWQWFPAHSTWISHVVCQSHPSNNDLPFTLHRSHISCRTHPSIHGISHHTQDKPDVVRSSWVLRYAQSLLGSPFIHQNLPRCDFHQSPWPLHCSIFPWTNTILCCILAHSPHVPLTTRRWVLL